jgi:hypothetical protein
LVVTEARKQKDKATIDKQTAGILLDKAKIDAQSVVVAAEAKAFEKKALLEADNALQVKLNAWLTAQKYWSDAHARKPVPQTVFGTGGGTDGPLDQRNSVQNFMDLVIMKSAKDLNVDIGIALPGSPATK